MLVNKKLETVFEKEDLVFCLKTNNVLSISERIIGFLDKDFFSDIKTLGDFETKVQSFSPDSIPGRKAKLTELDDYRVSYDFLWKEKKLSVEELIWLDRSNQTLHIYIFMENERNAFELPEHSLTEIVDKMVTPTILFSYDLSEVLMANSQMISLLTIPVSQLTKGFSVEDFFVDSSSYVKMLEWRNNPRTNKISISSELRLKNFEGNWFELRLFNVKMDEIDCILCFLVDINNIKVGESRLKRSNKLLSSIVEVQKHFLAQDSGTNPYQLLLSNILGVIEANLGFVGEVAYDPNGKQVLKIHAATDISGNSEASSKLYNKYVKDDFLFRHFDNLFGACILGAKVILENDPPSNPHTKGVKVPGHPHIENFLGIPILKGDTVVGLIGLGNKPGGFHETDISDLEPFASTYSVIIEAFNFEVAKLKYEKESFEKALILSKVAVHSPDLIVMMNEKYELDYISNSVNRFFETANSSNAIHRKIRALLKRTLSEKYKVSEENYQSRLQVNIHGLGEFWLESVVSVIKENEKLKFIAIIRDVSVQAQIEKNLKLSLNKEREINSFVNDFMNTVSHEFKTPLATIMSSLELSNHYLENEGGVESLEKISNHLNKIQKEVNNLHQLVSQSMDYNRFANRETTLKKERVSFLSFIGDCLQKYGFQSNIDVIDEVGHDFEVDLDKFLLETCLNNLLGNAIKYGGSSKPKLCLFSKGKRFGFIVADQGIGIKKEELAYVFTPFFRGSNVNGIEGTGFGLVAVKNFVELHSGKITIESSAGNGTIVEVSFPE